MLDEGIQDGDIIICQETQTADNGQIVVALVDNEAATLKRLQNKDETVTLLPANSQHTHKPTYIKSTYTRNFVGYYVSMAVRCLHNGKMHCLYRYEYILYFH